MGTALWRAAGVGPQVQVPMFYDAHYLYPRPWTQDQSAPGVPPPAPLAFYGSNTISQSFRAATANLSMLEISLSGPPGTVVNVELADDRGQTWQTQAVLQAAPDGALEQFRFKPITDSQDRLFSLTLSAPQAQPSAPAVAYAVGGDRLGASWQLNQFSRPGNLALTSYAAGAPGRWWLDALSEQLLPGVFRLRLQQYKPSAFKGSLFSWLLAATASLSIGLLWLARPYARPRYKDREIVTLGWTLCILFGTLLFWQFFDGRAQLARNSTAQTLTPVSPGAPAPTAADAPLLFADLTSDLWFAAREPEARFVHTATIDGYPVIITPLGYRVRYSLIVPPDGHLHFAVSAGNNEFGRAEVLINEEVVETIDLEPQAEQTSEPLQWRELDLSAWTGQGVTLTLHTPRSGTATEARVQWYMPQITTDPNWLLAEPPGPDQASPAGFRFADAASLRSFTLSSPRIKAGEALTVSLFWEALTQTERYGTVFVHLIDEDGRLVAQHDAQPVQNVFPLPRWLPGMIIRDDHPIPLPSDLQPGTYALHVGIYDPDTLERWPVTTNDGRVLPEASAKLVPALEILP